MIHSVSPTHFLSPSSLKISPFAFEMQSMDNQQPLVQSKSIAYVFGERIVAPILEKGARAIHAIDSFFSKAMHMLPFAGADDVGQIGYFEGDCPDKWVEYPSLQGRVVVGAGSYFATTEDGREESTEYVVHQKGGEVNHTLTTAELPPHDHSNGEFNQILKTVLEKENFKKVATPSQIVDPIDPKPLLSVGNNIPHNNLPPFYVLKACKRVEPELSKSDWDNFNALEKRVKKIEEHSSTATYIMVIIAFGIAAYLGVRYRNRQIRINTQQRAQQRVHQLDLATITNFEDESADHSPHEDE